MSFHYGIMSLQSKAHYVITLYYINILCHFLKYGHYIILYNILCHFFTFHYGIMSLQSKAHYVITLYQHIMSFFKIWSLHYII